MAEPIQQRRGQLLIAKDLHPFAKRQIARNDRGALAVPFSQDVKEQLTPGTFKRHKAEFIHNQQIDFHQALLVTPSRPLISGFDEGTHERRRTGQQHTIATPRRFDAEPNPEMRFSRPNRSDHDDIFAFREVLTAGQFQHFGP